MRLIDSHIHMDRMAGEDILRMAWAGCEAAVIPSPHLMSGLFEAKTLIELWEKTLNYMVKYAASMGIDVYVALAVPFYGLAHEGYDECLKKLPEYLKEKRVIGMGEIGLDTGNEHEQYLLKAQLAMAKERNFPVILHTPTPRQPQTSEVTPQIIDFLKKEQFPLEKAVLDHSGKNTIPLRLKSGCITGLSICYDKLTAEEVSEIVRNNPVDRDKIIIGSELGYGGAGHLSIVKAAWAMKMDGMTVKEIEKVTWDNPKRIFNLPVK
jgi:predicted metal-dependent TIM-barrel fold hydrolase